MHRLTHSKKPTPAFFTKKSGFLFLSILFSGLFAAVSAGAQGNLMLMQKRVVFEGGRRIATVEYGNSGRDTARYTVSLVHLRMNGDGSMERIAKPGPGDLFADSYVRYFPHNIVLAPGESQTMKIQLINTRDMKPGEYRSHLYFRATPQNNAEAGETDRNNREGISVSLKAVFGITIPLIVRAGPGNASAQLTDVALKDENGTPYVEFNILRSGNFSVYGDITVTHVSPSGKETIIGKVKGVAVYTPGTLRRNRLSLVNGEKADLQRGKLIISYDRQTEKEGTPMATAELQL